MLTSWTKKVNMENTYPAKYQHISIDIVSMLACGR